VKQTTRDTIRFHVNKVLVATSEDRLTGARIKALGEADPTDLLELRDGDKKIPVQDDQVVELKNGMQFRTYPGGADS
jgi:hypothetical protein